MPQTKSLSESLKDLRLYVVLNSKQQFFRPAGMTGRDQWVYDITKAKIYPTIGPARAVVTNFAKNSNFEHPQILEIKMSEFELLDESERINKALKSIERQKITQRIREIEFTQAKKIAELKYRFGSKANSLIEDLIEKNKPILKKLNESIERK